MVHNLYVHAVEYIDVMSYCVSVNGKSGGEWWWWKKSLYK